MPCICGRVEHETARAIHDTRQNGDATKARRDKREARQIETREERRRASQKSVTKQEPGDAKTTRMKHETEQEKHVTRKDGICLAYLVALATLKV